MVIGRKNQNLDQKKDQKTKPRSCIDHLKNGATKCGYYKIYDAAGSGFTVYCDMETEPGAAWTLVMSWSFKNKLFSNFRYFSNEQNKSKIV